MLEHAAQIGGWMSESELAFLYAMGRSMPRGARVVEVGSWKGRSTVAICEGLRDRDATVWAVDTFEGDDATGKVPRDELLAEFRANTVAYDFLHVRVSDSVAASREFEARSLDWVFIDGYHSYDVVVGDIRAWQPKLNHGGLLSGHDYDQYAVAKGVGRFFGDVPSWDLIWWTRSAPRVHVRPLVDVLLRRALGRLPEVPTNARGG